MVKSRWKSRECALRGVALLTVARVGPDQETLDGLLRLRDEGLDLLLLRGAEAWDTMDSWTYSSF
jgi:hypothetical protein